jgi:hypothetical protein
LLKRSAQVWSKEWLPLVPGQEQRAPSLELMQELAVLPGPQWFERVPRRHGIELRKPSP